MTAAAACTSCGAPLAGRYCHACGQDSVPENTALGHQWSVPMQVAAIAIAMGLAWLSLASRRLFAESWPRTNGKALVVLLVGFAVDEVMLTASVVLTFLFA